MRVSVCSVAFTFALTFGAPAAASSITYTLEGRCCLDGGNASQLLAALNLDNGGPFLVSWAITVDSTTPDLNSSPFFGRYDGFLSSVVTIRSQYTLIIDGGANEGLLIANGPDDTFDVRNAVISGTPIAGYTPHLFRATVTAADLFGASTSDALPLAFDNTNIRPRGDDMQLEFVDGNGNPAMITASIDRITVTESMPVPEPATICLFGIGALGLVSTTRSWRSSEKRGRRRAAAGVAGNDK